MATLLADWSVGRIAEFRNSIGISQAALAERVGLSRPTLAKIEAGETARLSTVNFLVTRLEEEFGDQFAVIELVEVGPNSFELHFEKKSAQLRRESNRPLVEWTLELNALSRKVIEVTNPRNGRLLDTFHDELVEILEAYVRLSGLEISLKSS